MYEIPTPTAIPNIHEKHNTAILNSVSDLLGFVSFSTLINLSGLYSSVEDLSRIINTLQRFASMLIFIYECELFTI